MGIEIAVTRNVLEPLADDAAWFGMRDATARALTRQPENTLSQGIDPVGVTVFNKNQVPRLLQELRSLAQKSDERTRQDLENAISFIEGRREAIGRGLESYVAFLGD